MSRVIKYRLGNKWKQITNINNVQSIRRCSHGKLSTVKLGPVFKVMYKQPTIQPKPLKITRNSTFDIMNRRQQSLNIKEPPKNEKTPECKKENKKLDMSQMWSDKLEERYQNWRLLPPVLLIIILVISTFREI